RVELDQTLTAHPDSLAAEAIQLGDDGKSLIYANAANAERTGIASLLRDINEAGLTVRDVDTSQSSLEDIFVSLVEKDGTASAPQQEVAQ
ncbi:MAG: hypothetical protein ACFB01_16545, partial [Cohaesibacteraceae bacterium]